MGLKNSLHAQPDSATQNHWSGFRSYGGRHKHDEAPFSLWDEDDKDFRLPTTLESKWLETRYHATAIDFQFPVIVIETSSPPHPLPLTVAAVAAKFVLPPPEPIRNASGMRLRPIFDARPMKDPTDYTGLRSQNDPLDFAFKKWIRPTDHQLQLLAEAISRVCSPRRVHILCPRIIVELRCDDERTYQARSLRRSLGGYAVHYYHSKDSAFEGLCVQGKERPISPTALTQDTCNYLQELDMLCPGIQVSFANATKTGPYAQVSVPTTAGILLRNNHGQQRLTVSNQGFLNNEQVFHPIHHGTRIGEIDNRWEHLDVALVKLNPSVIFTNTSYTEAKVPRHLLRSCEIHDGKHFAVDGISAGFVFLQVQGLSMYFPERPRSATEIDFTKFTIFRRLGTSDDVPWEGMCGAAIVEDDAYHGVVAGFFHMGNADYAMAPCLDEIIDCSWGVV
ncbi:hypothetical protein MMC14_008733 [Varicellaria rhodocarpa]|nr:hypothetical protein [Varicellaria rhodocarpa]